MTVNLSRDSMIAVSPQTVSFNFEPGQTQYAPVTIQNIGQKICYVQVQCPANQYLSLRKASAGSTTSSHIPAIRLAPGMNTSLELVFNGVDMAISEDYNVDMYIKHDSGRLTVPVRCSAPKAECVLDGSLDFGFVTCGGASIPSREVHVINRGNRPGKWAAQAEGTIPLQLQPESGSLEPGEKQTVTAALQDISAGQFTGALVLTTDARPHPKRYSCSAQAVGATFQIVGQSGQTMLEVDFGSVLNHDKRVQTVYLVNSSSQSVTCGIELGSTATMKSGTTADNDLAEGDNPYASFVAAARARAQALAAASTAPFHVHPAHVQIPAFQKVPLKIIYTPVHSHPRKGFSTGLQTGTDLHNYTAVIQFAAETKRISRLPLKGKCVYNVAEVSPTSLHFHDNATSQQCQLQFSMKNRAKTLPIWYCIRELPAFFHVNPRRGTIPAEVTGAFDIMYKPKALGTHQGKVHVSVHTEHGRIVEERAIHVYGVCDNPLSVVDKARGRPHAITDSPGRLAARKAPPQRTSVVSGLKSQNAKDKSSEDEFDMGKFDIDKDEYDPGITKRVDALWLATNNMPASYTPTKGLTPEAMKKIPVRQETLCNEHGGNVPLDKAEIRAIRAGPPVVHFGTMATCAENTQLFCITNTLQKPIHALVDAKSHDHLLGSSNLSQAIPAGQSAVFSICLRSTSAKSYRHAVEFIINGLHFLHFDIHADVIDPMLSVSHSELEFALSTNDWLNHCDKVVLLENPNKFPCSFQWQVPSPSAFTVSPMTGTIKAASSLEPVIRWTQDKEATGKQEEKLVLRINGGVTSRTIIVHGMPPEGLMKFKTSTLHAGSVPVGLPVTATTFIMNKGLMDSVVRVMGSPNMECTPMNSLVAGGDIVPMEVAFTPQQAGTFKNLITAEQRGGKVLTLPVVAEAVMPQVSIVEREFNFGVVYFGANRKLPLTIVNTGPVQAQVVFDFTQHPLFSLFLSQEQWENTEEYSESPLQEKGRTTEIGAEEVSSEQCKGAGSRYYLDMKAGKSFTLNFIVTATQVASQAFPLPIFLPSGDESTSITIPEILVLADCLETRLTISPGLIDLGSCIVPSASSVRSAYEHNVTITNQQDSVLEWSCSPPTTEIVEGCKGVFTIAQLGGQLQPLESCTVKLLFVPKAAAKYAATIEFSAKLPHEEEALPLMTMELKGEGRYPQLLFDRPVAFLPAVPVGVTSQTQFRILNDGYDNVELRCRLPSDEENIPLSLEFPQGNVLGIAKSTVLVVVKMTVQRAQSFTADLEFLDENGTRYTILLSGVCDRSILTLQPFLSCNCWSTDGSDDGAICMSPELDYQMPQGSDFTVALPEVPKLLTVFINNMAQKGPYEDILSECMNSRGKVLIDLMEVFSGRTVSGKMHSFNSDPARAAPQIFDQYCNILAFLQRHGALVNMVHPEQLMASSEILQLLSTRSGQAGRNRQQAKLWQKVVTESDWAATVKHAWVYTVFQFMKIFVLSRIDVPSTKALPGTDWTQQPEMQNRINSNVYSIAECICLNWLTFHLRRVMPREAKQINNFGSDLEDGLALCAVLVSHWPALSSLQSQLHLQPASKSDNEANEKVFISMLAALQCPFQIEETDIVTTDACNLLFLVVYLYSWLPQLIPVSTVHFSGKLQEEQTRLVELSNPSNKALSYSIRLQGHPDFSIPSHSLTIDANGSAPCVVKCKPSAGRPQTSYLVLTSRRDAAALGRTMVLRLESEVLTDAPLKRIKAEKSQYEMKLFEFILVNPFQADCEFQISLHPIDSSPARSTPNNPKKGKKAAVPESEDRSLYPHPFGVFKTIVKLARNAEEKVRAAFLPFTSGVHLCTIKFADREHGSFCYELEGQALPPAVCAEHEFVMDINRPISAYIPMSTTNQQLEAAKKLFIDGHPLSKQKELVQMLNSQKSRENVQYSISHVSSIIQCSDTVTVADKGGQDNGNAVKLDLRPIGIGIYPDRIMLTSAYDVRLHDVEIHVKELEHTFTLAFSCQMKDTLSQPIPLCNSNADKAITVTAEITAKTEEAKKAFQGPPEVTVPLATPAVYPLVFTPPRIGTFKACLVFSVAATDEKWTYNLEAVGLEPPATEHMLVKCVAGSSKTLKLALSNPLDVLLEYTVFTDIPYVQGPACVELAPRGNAEYNMCMRPMVSGVTTGMVSFSNSTGQIQWYTFEVDVSEPPKIATINVQTRVGGAKEIEVQVCNPSDERVELTASYGHVNLVGPASIKLDAKQTDQFRFYFSPVVAGESTAKFILHNEKLGEFWYEVRMSTV